jgi:hypothetical protein
MLLSPLRHAYAAIFISDAITPLFRRPLPLRHYFRFDAAIFTLMRCFHADAAFAIIFVIDADICCQPA